MDREDDTVDGQNLANQFIWVNIGTSRLKRSKKWSQTLHSTSLSLYLCVMHTNIMYIYIYNIYIHHLVVIQLVVYVDGLPF